MLAPKDFRKKYLLPVTFCGVIAMALWSGTSMISTISPKNAMPFAFIETAAGGEADADLPKVNEADLKDISDVEPLPVDASIVETQELPPLRISPDKPEIIQLDRDAINVLVGSDETLRAVPDTNRTIVLIPKKPGATYFRATDAEGKTIMQRHVIVGAPDKISQYLRIRRACAGDDTQCKEFSVYYCPDMCHEVNVVQGESVAQKTQTPEIAPSVSTPEPEAAPNSEYVEPAK